ncbi:hypothetical protein O3G_MSEX009171 [Manduca sexta]|uniref:Uncharacterized protein n=1 Tax=Manduca sexta TaxID=7130 RepID=A0A922CR32_MANSE|nr:hypothetical protein O3G_MSEX009171 [Manduca sexta]
MLPITATILLQLYLVQIAPVWLRPVKTGTWKQNIVQLGTETSDSTIITKKETTIKPTVTRTVMTELLKKINAIEAIVSAMDAEETTAKPAMYKPKIAGTETTDAQPDWTEPSETVYKYEMGFDSLESLESFEVPTVCVPINGFLTTCHILRNADAAKFTSPVHGTISTMGLFKGGKVPATPSNLPEQYRCSSHSICELWDWAKQQPVAWFRRIINSSIMPD